MNVKKIIWVILPAALFATLAIIGIDHLRPSDSAERKSGAQISESFSLAASEKKATPQISEEISLIAVGDISFSRGVEWIVEKKKDINYPFSKMRDYLKSADLVFGNLETPITEGPRIPDFEMTFRSNPGTEQALKNAGFSILSLANNHTPNFGEKGLNDTFNYLESAGIRYVGAGRNSEEAYRPLYVEKNGIKLAFLAYNDPNVVPVSYEAGGERAGTAFMRTAEMVETVKKAKEKADFVIVSMHAGTEYADKPNDSQMSFAHAAIDSGADLVIGHHPHVVQTMENYKGKYIFYSLGNFVFDQMQSEETRQGLIVKIIFDKAGIREILPLPIMMKNFSQPEILENREAEKVLEKLR